MSTNPSNTEADSIAALVRANQQPILNDSANHLLVLPNGSTINLERFQKNPRRQRASVKLYEIASFIEYVNSFKQENATRLFGVATETSGNFSAVLDWHQDDGDQKAQWGEHTAQLSLVASPEWNRWLGKNNKPLSQLDFAEFIEDNQLDVITPDGGTLLDLIASLEGKKDVAFKSVRNLRNGSVSLAYSEEVTATGGGGRRDDAMELPDHIVVRLTPFVSSAGVDMKARLRFRVGDNGKLTFTYILNQPHKVIEEAFIAIRQQIESETSLTVHLGSGSIQSPPSN